MLIAPKSMMNRGHVRCVITSEEDRESEIFCLFASCQLVTCISYMSRTCLSPSASTPPHLRHQKQDLAFLRAHLRLDMRPDMQIDHWVYLHEMCRSRERGREAKRVCMVGGWMAFTARFCMTNGCRDNINQLSPLWFSTYS